MLCPLGADDQSGPGEMRAIDNPGLLMTGDVSRLSRPGQSRILLFIMWPRHFSQE